MKLIQYRCDNLFSFIVTFAIGKRALKVEIGTPFGNDDSAWSIMEARLIRQDVSDFFYDVDVVLDTTTLHKYSKFFENITIRTNKKARELHIPNVRIVSYKKPNIEDIPDDKSINDYLEGEYVTFSRYRDDYTRYEEASIDDELEMFCMELLHIVKNTPRESTKRRFMFDTRKE